MRVRLLPLPSFSLCYNTQSMHPFAHRPGDTHQPPGDQLLSDSLLDPSPLSEGIPPLLRTDGQTAVPALCTTKDWWLVTASQALRHVHVPRTNKALSYLARHMFAAKALR
ncbi:hypothetical protein SKAU_G00197790 [Synaphobranchus kaupii]|uniref:Uncharacterized protein n=1 Tax=Synaphobranchus kaupii TaxID=118154 RepID=A0A9Q1FEW3_SYNKA|nr:hypothetical protein SKAU_G00197790 [Synaphobranchus kaupii]